jgi:hypothetical protein
MGLGQHFLFSQSLLPFWFLEDIVHFLRLHGQDGHN